MKRIYFAGPLFNEAEKTFNVRLTKKLEELGFEVYLPQRDGGETHQGESAEVIFKKDVEAVHGCDIFLFIADGRVPDEGAAMELGMAYILKKKIVGFKTDVRGMSPQQELNVMLSQALDFLAHTEDELFEYLKK